ncbi:hypothetical protein Mhypo_02754 [Meiothermus hypogaeus]|uniref:Uncharacterized protein n=1 Tax=Meiothermus hypogaeus TaxID=884155 RepID=A0ABX9MLC9_9DEIN|nr:hypothetical protein Mhypo_02754 [Meiothermus hypogaeus]
MSADLAAGEAGWGIARQFFHQLQTVEGVRSVKNRAGGVDLAQVVFHIMPVERRPAQHHRQPDVACCHVLQVFLHHHGALDQQAAHAYRVGPVLFYRCQNLLDGLLDAQIDHLVAVVGEDDVHQVLANVVHVALNRSEYHGALVDTLELFHFGLEVAHGGLHGFGGLQHKGQLHLACAEQVTHHLHALQEYLVDNLYRRVPGEGELEVGLEAHLTALDDAFFQALLEG